VLLCVGALLLLSYHYSHLIPIICKTVLVLGTLVQFLILLVYNFSSCFLGILFSDHLQSAHIVPMFLLVSEMYLIRTVLVVSRMSPAYAVRGLPQNKCTDFLFKCLLDSTEITNYLLQIMTLGKLLSGSNVFSH